MRRRRMLLAHSMRLPRPHARQKADISALARRPTSSMVTRRFYGQDEVLTHIMLYALDDAMRHGHLRHDRQPCGVCPARRSTQHLESHTHATAFYLHSHSPCALCLSGDKRQATRPCLRPGLERRTRRMRPVQRDRPSQLPTLRPCARAAALPVVPRRS